MPRSRAGVVLSVALHATALVVIGRIASDAREPAASPPARRPTVYWLEFVGPAGVVGAASPVAIEPPPRAAEPRRPAPARAPAPRRNPPAPATAPPATEPAQEVPRAAPVDFTAARQRAAKEVLAERDNATSYRSFSFVGTIAQQAAFDDDERFARVERGLQAPLTAFDSPAKGRAGGIERNGLGQATAWVSDDCYRLSGTGNLFLDQLLPGFMNAPTICTRRDPRTDVFATAKPTYLMGSDELAEAQQAGQRFERLRRPTTGVVMAPNER